MTNSGKGSGVSSVTASTYLSSLAEQQDKISAGITTKGKPQKGITTPVDWRARLRPKNGGSDIFWKGKGAGDYLMKPLQDTGGLVWQYTPDLLISAQVNYNMPDFHGQNYPLMTYKNTMPPAIPVTSDFSANTIAEARYLLGVMHFCKVATKSFGGDAAVADGYYGTPPPVLLFEYLGAHGFNKVPVVLTSYNISYPADVDYVPVRTQTTGEEVTYVPSLVNIQLNLQPSYTPHKLRKRFDLGAFTAGTNYKDGFI
jgi:hypothetical protein|tara:strand:- start:142 stop:909 length:768 start_codon:yes stop_codon:yes gene_type:complete